MILADTGPIPYCTFPCRKCPWKPSTPPGQFTAERYVEMRETSPQHDNDEPDWGAKLFACHKTPLGEERACAGWLASVAHRHLGVRLAVAQGRIPRSVLAPRPDWPALFETYPEMESRQAAPAAPAADGGGGQQPVGLYEAVLATVADMRARRGEGL
ncbi:DUF6283 family protein [Embleya sp. NPDC001921]